MLCMKDVNRRVQFQKLRQMIFSFLNSKNLLIGFGRAISSVKEDNNIGSGWIFRVDVNSWIMGTHVSNYGIKWANVEGSPYATVKEVERSFALEKMEENWYSILK